MEEDKIASVGLELIRKDFGLNNDFQFTGNDHHEELMNYLIGVVQYLLDNDFETLLNVMYRIDLPENRVKKMLTTTHPENLAGGLSKLILDREMMKAKTRIQYSK